jgi:ADP-ribosylglycohydrolase
MIGAIAGDIIGSYFEAFPTKEIDFPLFHEDCRFTDDTVLTVAVADWMLNGGDLVDHLHRYFHAYRQAGFGMSFIRWAGYRHREPYNSWGNGSAMRVSPVGWAFDSLDKVLSKAKESAEVTHNHEEGIRGAQATAAAIFLARTGHDKREIKDYIQTHFDYDLNRTIANIRPGYTFDESCQGSVPESIIAFLESTNYEHAVRIAVSLGGDADTMACVAGAIAEAYFGGVPEDVRHKVFEMLDEELAATVNAFLTRIMHGAHTQNR